MTGVVLSGGGARGFAHVGVLKALAEMSIKPDMISGVSSGAVMGAYYGAGFGFDDIVEIVRHTKLYSILDFRLRKLGLFKAGAVQESLERHLKGFTFKNLNLPLTVIATDFKNGTSCYISEGDLVQALLASSAIPVLYQPEEINNLMLVDGGLLNNFPTEPLKDKCSIIIGVHVNPLNKTDIHKLDKLSVLDRSFHMAVSGSVQLKKQQCNFFIEPPQLTAYGMFDMKHAEEIAAIGYSHTMSMSKEIERAVSIVA